MIPDTPAMTCHLEFRYGSDVDALAQYNAGPYAYPVFFSKRCTTCQGSGEPIPAHADLSRRLDYEAELQTQHKQWYFGKSLDGFAPMGLCIVTRDEIPFPPALAISTRVNGELRQNSNTRMLIHGIAEIVSTLCRGMLLSAGFRDVTMCDRKGAIYEGRDGFNWIKAEMAQQTNLEKKAGSIADMLVGADVFIGVSGPGTVTTEMVKTMAKDAIVFACANPTPGIFPDDAKAGDAAVISTGRSDYPNHISNAPAFPGIFRGAFDVRASDINEAMKMAARRSGVARI